MSGGGRKLARTHSINENRHDKSHVVETILCNQKIKKKNLSCQVPECWFAMIYKVTHFIFYLDISVEKSTFWVFFIIFVVTKKNLKMKIFDGI